MPATTRVRTGCGIRERHSPAGSRCRRVLRQHHPPGRLMTAPAARWSPPASTPCSRCRCTVCGRQADQRGGTGAASHCSPPRFQTVGAPASRAHRPARVLPRRTRGPPSITTFSNRCRTAHRCGLGRAIPSPVPDLGQALVVGHNLDTWLPCRRLRIPSHSSVRSCSNCGRGQDSRT